MSDLALQPQIEAANAYESLFVPALFRQWTGRVADTARIKNGDRVLDVACGTGILAREIVARVGPTGRVAGIDPSPGMIAVARHHAPDIDWREGVAESLPFAEQTFDSVVCQFGLMFFTDKRKAICEMLRVVTSGGRLAAAVWDSIDNIPAFSSLVTLLDQIGGRDAGDALRAPFVLGDLNLLAELFSEAGAHAPELATHSGIARFPSIRVMVEAELRGWLPLMGVFLGEDAIGHILKEAEERLRSYTDEEGQVSFQTSAHIVAVTKT